MSSSKKGPLGHKVSLSNNAEVEERRGLLYSPHEDIDNDDKPTAEWPAKRIWTTALALIALLILGTSARTIVMPNRWSHSNASHAMRPGCETLSSNGTHNFKQTVVIVSIDGLRYALPLSF